MNRRNDWENTLAEANKDLKRVGKEIKITDYCHDGSYTCEICKDGVSLAVYAENYYEDELEDLINDAWDYVLNVLKREEDEDTDEKVTFVIAETMGTDGYYYSEVYPCKSGEEAFECACSLIADMAETMNVPDVNPETDWVIGADDESWWYRVGVKEEKFWKKDSGNE